MPADSPTPDAELNGVLRELAAGAQAALGDNFVAAYLQGSFAVGEWDVDSDVDFLIAIGRDVTDAELSALQALHARLYRLPSHWAQHLEGSYVPTAILRRAGATRHPLYFLDNTGQALARSVHDDTRVVRWVVREHGITLAGPAPETLIDPVPADDLRREVRANMRDWAGEIRGGRYQIDNRWAWPFVVLSYCRMLQTLETGRIDSKRAGARWARGALDPRWSGLIQRAEEARPDPSTKVRQAADPPDVAETLEFIEYALDVGDAEDAV